MTQPIEKLLKMQFNLLKKYGPSGAIINNAEIMLLNTIISQCSKEWDIILDVNAKGLFNGIHTITQSMAQQKRNYYPSSLHCSNTSSKGKTDFPRSVKKYSVRGGCSA